ncbi:uncharacterized protein LOC133525768 [Cydia pomonella]|uniref:uncharacterized protein LOC133525768 n=1 Tax=Cydia pomonella TaxID=82600 RepID=UPI002ADD5D34|nr:uncharacterized protein LOC133525768 [Cydia pomonella]
MDESDYLRRLVLITLLCVLPSVYCKDICVKKTPCRCEFPNGTYIDLTPSANNIAFKTLTSLTPRSQDEATLTTYYYHPCHDITMNTLNTKDSITRNNCDKPSALCRHGSVWNKTRPDTLIKFEEYYEYIGSSNDLEFAEDGSYIKYLNKPSQALVFLVCAESDDQLEIKDLSDPSSLELIFYSRNACLKPEHSKVDISAWDFPLMQIACRTLLRMSNAENSTTTTLL